MRRSPLLLLVLFAACGDSAMPIDAGRDLGSLPDLGTDAGLAMSDIYGPCVDDSQCPGAGAVCRHNTDGWPHGYCTVSCTPPDDTPCNDSAGYVNRCDDVDGDGTYYCEQKCLNGVDCGRPEYTCVGAYPGTDTTGAAISTGTCVGVCMSDADCGDGAVCDPSGRCVTALLTGGMPNGSACMRATDCASRGCITAADPLVGLSAPSEFGYGFVGGYCTQWCILPPGYNSSTFFSSTTLPQGGCPTDQVCFPVAFPVDTFGGAMDIRMLAAPLDRTDHGAGGFCAATCTQDTDCRAGYECFIRSGGMAFDKGVCVPGCARHTCPGTRMCLTDSGGGKLFCY